MTRLLALVTLSLAMAFTSAITEARSKRIHVNAEVVETTLIGDPPSPRSATSALPVSGYSTSTTNTKQKWVLARGFVRLSPHQTQKQLVQCFITATFDKRGQLIFGGTAPLPNIGAVGHFGILGGTDDFRKARGEVTLVVISDKLQDATFDIEIDSERRHGKFTAQ